MGSDATMCPAVPCGSRASSIKKCFAGLSVKLGTHVLNARTHVSDTPDVRTNMSLQDVRAGSADHACKTCRQLVTVQRKHRRPLAWHRYSAE
jgi:hypothetical protein